MMLANFEARIAKLLQQHEASINAWLAEEPIATLCREAINPLRLANLVAASTERLVNSLVASKYREAVLVRAAERMPLALIDSKATPAENQILLLLASIEKHNTWPAEVSFAEVAEALESTKDPDAKNVASALRKSEITIVSGSDPTLSLSFISNQTNAASQWPPLSCAIIISLVKEVKRGLEEPMIAIDAGHPHHRIVTGWAKEPKKKGKRKMHTAKDTPGRIELLAPGG